MSLLGISHPAVTQFSEFPFIHSFTHPPLHAMENGAVQEIHSNCSLPGLTLEGSHQLSFHI